MSANLYLNAAIMVISLFNALLLTWLGLTVVLNSDRRVPGLWIASAGLLLGGLFFISHSAVAGIGLSNLTWRSMVFWWILGMVPVTTLPFAWYVVILWYAGYWQQPAAPLQRRHRWWLLLVLLMLLAGLFFLSLGVILIAFPTPSLNFLRSFIRWSVAGIPLLAFGYSVYALLCTGLALDALRQPGTSTRVMGSKARRRAQPWLIAASLVLLLVGLFVTGIMLWIVQDVRGRSFFEIYLEFRELIARLDLIVSVLICTAILLIGQAIVSYEVFTGKTLPRRGLLRHWRRAVLLSGGIALLVTVTLIVQLRPLYSLVLVAMLTAVFYALISWRSYEERERFMAQLRPFVSSQRLIDQLLDEASPGVNISLPFRALCADLLDARLAYLTAVGPLAPLVGEPLAYPESVVNFPPVHNLAAEFTAPELMVKAIEPERYQGALFVVPLWSERGLIGLFFLGEKNGGGLYSQEDIEIARVSGERLIDTQASSEMAQRLMRLQRERLAQSQIIDQQTRRVLHDDILPGLQAALISLSQETTSANGRLAAAVDNMTEAHKKISDLLHDMPTTTVPDVARLGLIPALQRAVENDLAHAFDQINWQVEEEAAAQARSIPTLTAEVVFYAAREVIRNSAKYGRGDQPARPLHLAVYVKWIEGLIIQIDDDGVGFPGSSGAAGGGHGLAIHSTMMAVVGGTITVDATVGEHSSVRLALPAA